MHYSVTSSGLVGGLIQDCEDLLGMSAADISGDATKLKAFTKNINAWYRRVNSWIWRRVSDWEYDDSNFTDLPIAVCDLVNAQQDYEIPSVAQKIDRVEVLDSSGDYTLLSPIDKSQITSDAMSEYLETSGLPEVYDLVGRSLMLYPKPSSSEVTTTDGLKLYFSRDIQEFPVSATTTEPGFVSNFHRILSLGASLDYCIGYIPDDVNKINNLRAELNDMKGELEQFYTTEHRGMERARIKPQKMNYK